MSISHLSLSVSVSLLYLLSHDTRFCKAPLEMRPLAVKWSWGMWNVKTTENKVACPVVMTHKRHKTPSGGGGTSGRRGWWVLPCAVSLQIWFLKVTSGPLANLHLITCSCSLPQTASSVACLFPFPLWGPALELSWCITNAWWTQITYVPDGIFPKRSRCQLQSRSL